MERMKSVREFGHAASHEPICFFLAFQYGRKAADKGLGGSAVE